MASPAAPLTQAEKDHFLRYGFVHLKSCFTKEQAAEACQDVWTRLGMSETDKTTWTKNRINMPSHRTFDCSVFAPKAWAAICELCGGEDRVTAESRLWKDSWIVNLGTAEREGKPTPPKELDNWHVDGDFFVHYLDSPEQALLVIPLFTEILSDGGGTMIAPEAIHRVAKWLYDHPDGVSPRMVPRGDQDFTRERNLEWYIDLVQSCTEFFQATGEVGDVYLLHPLMMHSASNNALRNVRIIINPPVSLKEPHMFDREDGQYSLVEQKTRQGLGMKGWRITRPREGVVPARLRIQEKMKVEEARRLEEAKLADPVA